MKNIRLHFDDKFFYKMKEHKAKKEKMFGEPLNWEEYIKLLFGIRLD